MLYHDEPHKATETDAGTGQGTVEELPHGEHQDRPVLDGSTESPEADASTDDPRRGMSDPGLIRHPERGKRNPEND